MSYTRRRNALAGLLLTLLLVSLSPAGLWAQPQPSATEDRLDLPEKKAPPLGALDSHALIALPLAALLGAALAVRPRRRGTPQRSLPVIQTQIILSIIGAVVMIIVGSSLARAFGIVGAAGLVRYRAKIEDPKDAGVMLCTLAVGLACGVGVYGLGIFTTVFIVAVLWVIESFEPKARKAFILEVKAKDASKVQPKVEALLRRHRIRYELREVKPDEFQYQVQLPMDAKTDSLSAEIIAVDPSEGTEVEWKPEKTKGA
jgi:uncharacterized protein DUF4956/MgtC family protein